MFQGYCKIPGDGGWTPPVHLETPEAAVRYVRLQKIMFPEVRVVDTDDYIVLHAVNHKIVFPQELAEQEALTTF